MPFCILTRNGIFAILIYIRQAGLPVNIVWSITQEVEGVALEMRVDASPRFSISHEETSDFDVLTGFLTGLNDAFSNNILALNF